jgi:XTP/dITP diphosphohydrolase
MRKLYIGTSNKGKLKEYYSYLSDMIDKFELLSIDLDIDEPYDSLTENAEHKAITYSNHVNDLVLAEDSGFFVHVLDRLPGIYSARFYNAIVEIDTMGCFCISGFDETIKPDPKDISDLNIQKVYSLMNDYPVNDQYCGNHRCHYHTTICIADKGKLLKTIHGKCDGFVADYPWGTGGFGYDCIFIPTSEIYNDEPKTFAELKETTPNLASARGNAIIQLKKWLNYYY